MKRLTALLLLIVSIVLLNSCQSEYQERLEEAKLLHERLLLIEETNFVAPNEDLITEMKDLREEIHFLAKVSGNEELFLDQVFEN